MVMRQIFVRDPILMRSNDCLSANLSPLIRKTLINKEILTRKGQDFCVLLQFITL